MVSPETALIDAVIARLVDRGAFTLSTRVGVEVIAQELIADALDVGDRSARVATLCGDILASAPRSGGRIHVTYFFHSPPVPAARARGVIPPAHAFLLDVTVAALEARGSRTQASETDANGIMGLLLGQTGALMAPAAAAMRSQLPVGGQALTTLLLSLAPLSGGRFVVRHRLHTYAQPQQTGIASPSASILPAGHAHPAAVATRLVDSAKPPSTAAVDLKTSPPGLAGQVPRWRSVDQLPPSSRGADVAACAPSAATAAARTASIPATPVVRTAPPSTTSASGRPHISSLPTVLTPPQHFLLDLVVEKLTKRGACSPDRAMEVNGIVGSLLNPVGRSQSPISVAMYSQLPSTGAELSALLQRIAPLSDGCIVSVTSNSKKSVALYAPPPALAAARCNPPSAAARADPALWGAAAALPAPARASPAAVSTSSLPPAALVVGSSLAPPAAGRLVTPPSESAPTPPLRAPSGPTASPLSFIARMILVDSFARFLVARGHVSPESATSVGDGIAALLLDPSFDGALPAALLQPGTLPTDAAHLSAVLVEAAAASGGRIVAVRPPPSSLAPGGPVASAADAAFFAPAQLARR